MARRVCGRGAADQRIFQIFDLLAEFVQDDEVAVHDRVEEGMGKVVRPGLPQAALLVAEPLPDRVEESSLLLLKGDQPVAAEDDADLLGDKTAAGVFMEEPEDDVEIIAVVLALRALLRVQDVFEDERVEAEDVPHLFEELDFMETVDVDPGDGPSVGGEEPLPGSGSPFPGNGFRRIRRG